MAQRTMSAPPGVMASGPGLPAGEGRYSYAICVYQYEEKGKVVLRENDMVLVTDSSDNDWWCGLVQGATVVFPKTYVEPIQAEDYVQVKTLFEYFEKGMPVFKPGQVIDFVSQAQADWWEGELDGRHIVFPSSYVQVIEAVSEGEQKKLSPMQLREECLSEILDTERAYVGDLKTLTEACVARWRSRGLLTAAQMSELFSNIEQIVQVNTAFLAQLEQEFGATRGNNVGAVFTRNAETFKCYKDYCANYTRSQACLNNIKANTPSVAAALDELRTIEDFRGLELADFLIKPIQRLCKYPLFFRELLKYTPETHPDFRACSMALELLQGTASFVNESMMVTQRLKELQGQIYGLDVALGDDPSRILIREGYVLREGDGKAKERYVFLFNDFIIITSVAIRDFYKFKDRVPLDDVVVKDVSNADAARHAIEFQRADKKKSFVFVFRHSVDKNDWMSDLATWTKRASPGTSSAEPTKGRKLTLSNLVSRKKDSTSSAPVKIVARLHFPGQAATKSVPVESNSTVAELLQLAVQKFQTSIPHLLNFNASVDPSGKPALSRTEPIHKLPEIEALLRKANVGITVIDMYVSPPPGTKPPPPQRAPPPPSSASAYGSEIRTSRRFKPAELMAMRQGGFGYFGAPGGGSAGTPPPPGEGGSGGTRRPAGMVMPPQTGGLGGGFGGPPPKPAQAPPPVVSGKTAASFGGSLPPPQQDSRALSGPVTSATSPAKAAFVLPRLPDDGAKLRKGSAPPAPGHGAVSPRQMGPGAVRMMKPKYPPPSPTADRSSGDLQRLQDTLQRLVGRYQQAKDHDRIDEALVLKEQMTALEVEISKAKASAEGGAGGAGGGSGGGGAAGGVIVSMDEITRLLDDYESAKAQDRMRDAVAVRDRVRQMEPRLQESIKACQVEYEKAKRADRIDEAVALKNLVTKTDKLLGIAARR